MEKLVEHLAGPKIVDLLWHLPTGLIDRRYTPKISVAEPGRIATLAVTIGKHTKPRNRRQPYRVRVFDETGEMDMVFFHAKGDYLEKQLPEGTQKIISGRVEKFRGFLQMTHPDAMASPDDKVELDIVEPVYPLTAGLTARTFNKAMKAALTLAPDFEDWLDPAWRKKQGWGSWKDALLAAHAPQNETDLHPTTPARTRLAYDEILANQLALALVRHHQRKKGGRALAGKPDTRVQALAALPFELTQAQKDALGEIDADMAAGTRMLRLLQGDVGSGKTVVAFLAILNALDNGAQAAFMAPTEILARQHALTIEPLARKLGVSILVLTGRDKGKIREDLARQIAEGQAQIVIGTHALFQEGIKFKNLAFAVIDEQHRFGVHQRLKLSEKGVGVDVLVMTATPIPRTLALTAYGDMDVSRITEKPAGRKPVDTRLISENHVPDLITGLKRKITEGARAYWVCPLVEESEVLDLAAVEDRYAQLKAEFGGRVGLVHGRMKGEEKDAVMAAFTGGDIDILVATTVIEVGVNVPEATVMVIEGAERFGLAQLHQLRGRIGRGKDSSTCLLIYTRGIGKTAKERLTTLRDTEDGFVIAEKDLELRGAGEVLGTRQSGLPEFRLADLKEHAELVDAARDDASLIVAKDPTLSGPRGEALKTLLYLFERDEGIRYLKSG